MYPDSGIIDARPTRKRLIERPGSVPTNYPIVSSCGSGGIATARDHNYTHLSADGEILQGGGNFYWTVLRHFTTLVSHPHGLCVMKEAMSFAPEAGPAVCGVGDGADSDSEIVDFRVELRDKLVEHTNTILECPYGNYALQHAFICWGWNFAHPIVEALRGQFAYLSTQKFSSNVVECILAVSSHSPNQVTFVDILLEELLSEAAIPRLTNSVFAWYVIRKGLSVATHSQAERIRLAIDSQLTVSGAASGNSQHHKKLRQKWERILEH